MIKLEHVVLPSPEQMEFVIEGMRNPMNSWDRSDSGICNVSDLGYYDCDKTSYDGNNRFCLGDNDKDRMNKLAKAGTEHRKYMRMMPVYVRITAPLYWWKEFDTYKVGTVANSCSTMHKIAEKPFAFKDFSLDHLVYFIDHEDTPYIATDFDSKFSDFDSKFSPYGLMISVIDMLNTCRERYLVATKTEEETGLPAKVIWWQMIQLLPSSYNQTRNVMLNYEVLSNMYHQRKNHKLDEWLEFCKWIETLPYSEIITGKMKEK